MSTFHPWSAPPIILDEAGKVFRYHAVIVSWTDGDTAVVDCLIDEGFEEMSTKRRRVRLMDVDTPEKNDKDPGKRLAAMESWGFVRGLAPIGYPVVVDIVKFDKYGGRDDGRISINGSDIAQSLIAFSFGKPYNGGAR